MNNFKSNKNIMCFDFGLKKIGIAIGDNLFYFSHPIKTINYLNNIFFWKKLKKIINNWNPCLFVIGFPYGFTKNNNKIQNKIKIFYLKLNFFFKKKIFFQDESFTTSEARILLKNYKNKYLKKNKDNIHSISASIILKDWFLLNKLNKNI